MYTVEVKVGGGWTMHSQHESYHDAVDQSDMVHGRVMLSTGGSDMQAWRWAAANQGFDGDFAAWQSLDDDERAEYEKGAAGLPTA